MVRGSTSKRASTPEPELSTVPSWEEGAEFVEEDPHVRNQGSNELTIQSQSNEVRPRNFRVHVLNDACKNLESRRKVQFSLYIYANF